MAILNRTQVATLVNDATKNLMGDNATVVAEDLSNVADAGTAITATTDTIAYFSGLLIARIQKIIFGGNKEYVSKFPSLKRSAEEWGALLVKIGAEDVIEADEDPAWKLVPGQAIDQDIVYDDNIVTNVYKFKDAFEIPRTVLDRQIKGAFTGAAEMMAFVAWCELRVRQSYEVKVESLARACVANYVGELLNTANADRAINILAAYKVLHPTTTLTAATCLYDQDFLRFASMQYDLTKARLQNFNKLHNEAGYARFSDKESVKEIVLDVFKASVENYLKTSSNYGYEGKGTTFEGADVVSYWQGVTTGYPFADISAINVKTSQGHTVNQTGILAVIFDEKAMGVYDEYRITKSHINDHGEYTNYWYKFDAGYYNFFDENASVLYVAD